MGNISGLYSNRNINLGATLIYFAYYMLYNIPPMYSVYVFGGRTSLPVCELPREYIRRTNQHSVADGDRTANDERHAEGWL